MAMIRTYTETYDMNTEQDCPTCLLVHTPIGKTPYRFLAPAFRMYKKFKYLGCDVTIVNSARLPVDPEQVGKIGGTNYVDPRDMLNPILMKGCHGESLGSILDSMYNGLIRSTAGTFKDSSLDKEVFRSALQNFYYTALGDDSWRKSPIQKTLNIRGLHPLVYQMATQYQILPTNDLGVSNYKVNNANTVANPVGIGDVSGSENGHFDAGVSSTSGWTVPTVAPTKVYDPEDGTKPYVRSNNSFFTNKMSRLGWMDTLQYIGQNVDANNPGTFRKEMVAQLPKIPMALIIFPMAYLCRQYLRVLVRHKFKFAGYRSITTGGADESDWNPESEQFGYAERYTGNIDPESKLVREQDFDNEPIEGDDLDESY